ncbi:CGNR zinc finger domain-containing protein [Streptomyces sp. NBC_00454]|uniref:CGNR zinc finger domain-containing protein n=1 Tax=Streptomyces sp. NBC_00454 TaxID=2975747 RepID=UPI0030E49404
MAIPDPRPLAGEPLSIDLLNTRWIENESLHDLLETPDGLEVWLESDIAARELTGHEVRADRETLDALLAARSALAALVDSPADPAGLKALNAVLAHGWVRHGIDGDGPVQRVEVDGAPWLPAWLAADNYLQLLRDRAERIRPCANPECILHFYDTSKNGTRRWCSMSGCGNRAKASRHYARHRRD